MKESIETQFNKKEGGMNEREKNKILETYKKLSEKELKRLEQFSWIGIRDVEVELNKTQEIAQKNPEVIDAYMSLLKKDFIIT